MKYENRNLVDELDFNREDIDRVRENRTIASTYAGLSAVNAANPNTPNWDILDSIR